MSKTSNRIEWLETALEKAVETRTYFYNKYLEAEGKMAEYQDELDDLRLRESRNYQTD